jgi:hypothetical protein
MLGDDIYINLYNGSELQLLDTLKPKKIKAKPFRCSCGFSTSTEFVLHRHMRSRACTNRDNSYEYDNVLVVQKKRKAGDDDVDNSLQPHELIGHRLRECIDTFKHLKDTNASDEKIK